MSEIKTPDGSVVRDVRLGRIKQFDERSRLFKATAGIETMPFRSYTWRVGYPLVTLDQKSEGSCVGFAWAHELAARPVALNGIDAFVARELYYGAQKLDEWPGGAYPGASEFYEGTSVLAGAKACKALGVITEYRWAFGLDDVRRSIGYKGPVVLGLNWYEGMFEPKDDGQISPTGERLGGHAILANAVDEKRKRVLLHNSWGPTWGRPTAASCWLSFDDLGRLLHEQGEACIPAGRRSASIPKPTAH